MKTCFDYPDSEHCNSCHYEWDDGYGEPLEIYDGEELTHRLCCKLHTEVEAGL